MGCVIHEGLVCALALGIGHNTLGPEQRMLIPEPLMEAFGTERHKRGQEHFERINGPQGGVHSCCRRRLILPYNLEPWGLGQIAIHRAYEPHRLSQGCTQLDRFKECSHGTKSVVYLGEYVL